MRFKAHFIAQKAVDGVRASYWTTIDADTLPEADKIARRQRKTGYLVAAVIQDLNYAA